MLLLTSFYNILIFVEENIMLDPIEEVSSTGDMNHLFSHTGGIVDTPKPRIGKKTTPAVGDKIEISMEARKRFEEESTYDTSTSELTPKEEKEVEELKKRDQEVRAHENAHFASGGTQVRGGPQYEYVIGPDGKRYAVAGNVDIDLTEDKDPEVTIRKMQTVKRAALAPNSPSFADLAIASKASLKEAQARAELIEEKQEEAFDTEKKRVDGENKEGSLSKNRNIPVMSRDSLEDLAKERGSTSSREG